MKVLLTGATGQIGRAIAARLSRNGHVLIGISRGLSPVEGLSEHVQTCLGEGNAAKYITRKVLECEAIIHAAASLSHDLCDPSISLVNCLGTQQVIELAKIWGSSQLVYVSSLPVIGRPQYHPITEEHPVQPPTAYHASKLYGEHLMYVANFGGCRAVSLRLTSPAGPRTPDKRILSTFVRRALSNQPLEVLGRGTRKQNYVDVRDVAAAVEACITRRASGLYNIAAAESISNYSLAVTCVDELSSHSSVTFAEAPDPEEGVSWDVSIARARRDLCYQPQFTIRDSIRAISHEHPDSK